MKYAILINGNEQEWDEVTPEQSDAQMKEVFAWFEKWSRAGKIANGGVHLQPTSTAKTVRPGPHGDVVVTDGPYLELKEVIGGMCVLECDDIDEAAAVAGTWPGLTGSSSIEVRPVYDHSGS
ncbi:MAG TPA: YciI family protein [Micromonosporaceae bacterium]|jgi:hypothetical protein